MKKLRRKELKNLFTTIFLGISLLSFGYFYDVYDEYYYNYEATEEYNDVIGYIENNNIDEVKKIISNEFVHLNEKNSRGETFLSCAVANNNIKMVEYFVNKGAEIDSQDSQGVTPIMIGALNKNFEIVKYLDKKGADINIKDESGENALYYALKGGNLEIVKYFVNKGISYDKDNLFKISLWNKQYKITDYLYSIGLKPSAKMIIDYLDNSNFDEINAVEVLKKAVSYGLDINEKNEIGETLLGLAIRTNSLEILKYLLSKNVKLENILFDRDAFEYAILYGKEDALKLLLPKNKNINKKYHETKETLMHLACNEKANIELWSLYSAIGELPAHQSTGESLNMKIVFLLLKNGANLNEKNSSGQTPIEYLFYNNRVEEVKEIERKGYKIDYKENFGGAILSQEDEIYDFVKSKIKNYNFQDSKGNSPLHYAVISEDLTRVEEIINETKNIDIKNNEGKTPLHYAVEKKELEMIKLLLTRGADVNIKDKKGNTPIFYSYYKEQYGETYNRDMISLLLQYKADVLLKNDEGKSFFDIVKDELKDIEIIKIFIENEINISIDEEFFQKAILTKDVNLIKYILDKKPEYINLKTRRNNFIIMDIFESYEEYDRLEIIKYLVDKGVDLNIKNSLGNTPAFYCKSLGELELFINKGVNFNYKNENEVEVLDYIYVNNMSNEKLVKKLIENGFDINKKIIEGCSYIFYCENIEELKVLYNLGAEINIVDQEGTSLLEYYIKNKGKELTEELLSYYMRSGFKINESKEGSSLLIEALLRDDVDYSLVKQLIDLGADVNKIYSNQYTLADLYVNTIEFPLDVAEKRCLNKKIIDLLKQSGAKNYKENEEEIKENIAKYNKNYYNLVKLEVEKSKVKNVANNLLESYVSETEVIIDLKTFKYLVKKGADIGGDNGGKIIQNLMTNKIKGKYDIYKYLIKKKVKYNVDFPTYQSYLEPSKPIYQESIVYTYIENNASEKDILKLLENGAKLNNDEVHKYKEFFLALGKGYSDSLLKKLLGKDFKMQELYKLLSTENNITLKSFNKIQDLMGTNFDISVIEKNNNNLLTTYLEKNYKSIDLDLVEYFLKLGLKYEENEYSTSRNVINDEDIRKLLVEYAKEEGEDY